MKQRISIFIPLLAVCLLLSTLMACAPATPPADDTPVPTPDTTEQDLDTPIDSSVPEQPDSPQPEPEIIPEVILQPCIDMTMEFDSFEELEEQILAIRQLDSTCKEFSDYSTIGLASMQYYYVPAEKSLAPIRSYLSDDGKDIIQEKIEGEHRLTQIRVTPNLLTYTYVQDGTNAKIEYDIVKKLDGIDPLAEVEKRYERRRTSTGYIMVSQYNRHEVYYMPNDEYMVCFKIYKEWYEKNNIPEEEMRFILFEMSDVKQVYISPKPVTVIK